ncbi:cytochrome P450 [Streptomyces sp. NPDC054865]
MSVPLILLTALPPAAVVAAALAFAAHPPLAAAYRFRWLTREDDPARVPMLRIPDQHIHGPLLETLFADECASHRGQTHARRSIRYFHRPADEHQENIDPDHPRYAELAKATAHALRMPRAEIIATARACTQQVLDEARRAGTTNRTLRLMNLAVPISARLMFQLAFNTAPTREQAALIGRCATDSMRNSKGLRHAGAIPARLELLDLLRALVSARSGCPEIFGSDSALDTTARAKHLQGVFFNTGVIQLSEAVCHTLIEASRHPHVVARIVAGDVPYTDHVLSETLRLYPLHATIQRITADDIALSATETIPSGTQLLFDIGRHQRMGHPEPDTFVPERWEGHSRADGGFVGFGLGRRKCPAERFSRTAAAVIVRELLSSYAVHAPIRHTRGLEGGGLCCLTPHGAPTPPTLRLRKTLLRTRDRTERLAFGAAQLICLPLTARAVRRQPYTIGNEPSAHVTG